MEMSGKGLLHKIDVKSVSRQQTGHLELCTLNPKKQRAEHPGGKK